MAGIILKRTSLQVGYDLIYSNTAEIRWNHDITLSIPYSIGVLFAAYNSYDKHSAVC